MLTTKKEYFDVKKGQIDPSLQEIYKKPIVENG